MYPVYSSGSPPEGPVPRVKRRSSDSPPSSPARKRLRMAAVVKARSPCDLSDEDPEEFDDPPQPKYVYSVFR